MTDEFAPDDGADEPPAADPADEPPAADTDAAAPLADLAAEVRRRRESDDVDLSGRFADEDVGDVDVDAVWERIESGVDADAGDPAVDGSDVAPRAADETSAIEREAGDVVDESDERVVPKASYCQRCEHFSDPPAVECAAEGARILELVDADRFRVRNCPKVDGDERLGDGR